MEVEAVATAVRAAARAAAAGGGEGATRAAATAVAMAAQLIHAHGTRQAHERESARGYDTRHTHTRRHKFRVRTAARAPFLTSASVAARATVDGS